MKNILFLSNTLILIAAAIFSFNHYTEINSDPIYWDFIGNPQSQTDLENPEMYVLDPDNTPDCSVGNNLSEILASPQVGNEDYPDLSTEIVSARTYCD